MYRYPLRLCIQAGFAGHPYGRTLDEVERAVSVLSADQLRAWQRERMSADPWVFIAGDVDVEVAVREVDARIGSDGRNGEVVAPTQVWPREPNVLAEHRDKAQSALAIGFPGPQRNHPDVYALQVLANAVGGLGGRFFEELRSKRSLAYTVALVPVFRVAGGMFVGYIATTPEREAEARAGLFEQFAALAEAPLSAEEIERSKRYTIGTWQIRGQTNAARLSDLLQAHLLGSGMDEIDNFEAHIRAVDAGAIQEVAQRYFKPEFAVEGVVKGRIRGETEKQGT